MGAGTRGSPAVPEGSGRALGVTGFVFYALISIFQGLSESFACARLGLGAAFIF